MSQRIEFRFGKNSSFECDVAQVQGSLRTILNGTKPWVSIATVNGGTRWINTTRCTQILVGMPDKTPAAGEADK